jgi:ABC-type uncharacterized transport system permease subunit
MDTEKTETTQKQLHKERIDSRFVNTYLVPLLAVITAMIIGAVIIWWVGGDPITAFVGLFRGHLAHPKLLVRLLCGMPLYFCWPGGVSWVQRRVVQYWR